MAFSNPSRLLLNCVLFSRSSYKFKFALINEIVKAGVKKSVEESLGLPVRPKRPVPSFSRYYTELKPQLVSQYPDVPYNDLMKKAGDLWKNLDAEHKSKYLSQYAEQFTVYSKEIAAFYSDLSDDHKIALKHAKVEKRKKRQMRKLKREAFKLNKPKRPMNTFALYMKNKLSESQQTDKDHFLKFAQEWKQIDESEKQKYRTESEALIKQYSIDLAAWEEKMIREGHLQFVKKSSLPKLPTIRKTKPKRRIKKIKTKSSKKVKTKSSKKVKNEKVKSSKKLKKDKTEKRSETSNDETKPNPDNVSH